jgi:rare lipoprotein A
MRLSKTLTCAVFASGLVAAMGGTVQADPFQTGEASWYGPGFHGRKTANGERFDTNEMTAAHKTLPFGTKVKVTNKQTGRSVVVRINDRGPYAKDRVIDLSQASAQAIGISGVADVTLARL